MLNVSETLKSFFASFDLPAYTLSSVPDEVDLPYITFPLLEPEWNQQSSFYCQIWYPKNRLEQLLTKADEVAKAIAHGKRFNLPEGYLVLYPASPLIQTITDEHTQSVYMNLLINAYHMPGE